MIKNRKLVFYGKVYEQKDKKQPIPEEFKDSNMLRYEIRFLKRLPKQLKHSNITAKLLYNKDFYTYLVQRWKDEYLKIPKIKSRLSSVEPTGSKTRLFEHLAMITLDEYGQDHVLQMIKEWQKMKTITRKQAYDQRAAIKKISVSKVFEQESELIRELTSKIEETAQIQLSII